MATSSGVVVSQVGRSRLEPSRAALSAARAVSSSAARVANAGESCGHQVWIVVWGLSIRSIRPTRCSATRRVVGRSRWTSTAAPCRLTASLIEFEHSPITRAVESRASRLATCRLPWVFAPVP